MTMLAALLLAEMLSATNIVADAASTSPEAGGEASAAGASAPQNMKITSDNWYYDIKDGVMKYEGNVSVDAFVRGQKLRMNAAEVYVFLEGTNELKKVVALGDIVVTNAMGNGACSRAVYSKAANRLTMYGYDDGSPAWFKSDDPGKKMDGAGSKIKYWIDAEQLEVENPVMNFDVSRLKKGGKDGLSGFLGKKEEPSGGEGEKKGQPGK